MLRIAAVAAKKQSLMSGRIHRARYLKLNEPAEFGNLRDSGADRLTDGGCAFFEIMNDTTAINACDAVVVGERHAEHLFG